MTELEKSQADTIGELKAEIKDLKTTIEDMEDANAPASPIESQGELIEVIKDKKSVTVQDAILNKKLIAKAHDAKLKKKKGK